MVESLQMLQRLKNVNDLVNKKINLQGEDKNIMINENDIKDWNWFIKGKMRGTKKFSNLYNILTNKMKIHNFYEMIGNNDLKVI